LLGEKIYKLDLFYKRYFLKMVKTPVIGIPSWEWKKEAVSYAKKHLNIHFLNISDFCYECSRHFNLLDIIDNHGNFRDSEYYQYYMDNGRDDHYIIHKIDKFKKLYDDIKNNGCDISSIVTEDGCRLDGSHRLSILLHLNIYNANVNVLNYNFIFQQDKIASIKKQNSEYRKKVYDIE
jgi:hypothetical protein